jgi:hypothetical protein
MRAGQNNSQNNKYCKDLRPYPGLPKYNHITTKAVIEKLSPIFRQHH